jgi:hypothetical protein
MKLTHTFELRSLEESSLAKNFPINRWAGEQAPRNGFVPAKVIISRRAGKVECLVQPMPNVNPQENVALWIAEGESQ